MTLDPQAQMILDAMADSDFQLNAEYTPQQMRDGMTSGSMLLEADEVGKVEDASFAGPDGNDVPVRVYWPLGAEPNGDPNGTPGATLPGVVFFHGGGWVVGSIDTHDNQARKLCNSSGAVVVSVDYRLAPEHPYPAGLNDCYAATEWVAEHGSRFGIDTSRLAVAGDSAGGNLATVVAMLARDRGGPRLAFQLLVYPVCDMDPERWPSMTENAQGYFLTTEIMIWFYGHYMGDTSDPNETGGNDPKSPYISPIRADDLSGLPPALVITAEYDPLRDEGEAYGEALRSAGVEAEVLRAGGMFHGFFGFGEFIDKAAETMDYAGQKLKQALTPP